MKKTDKKGLAAVILYAACALIWTVRAILEVIFQTYNDSVFWFVVNVLCAVIWIAAFIVTFRKYRANKEEG